MENLDEVRKSWGKQPDEWLIKAATVDCEEYPKEIQEIIHNEIEKRGLKGTKYSKPSIAKEMIENVAGELFNPEKEGYMPRYLGLSKMFLPIIILFEKGGGAVGVFLGEGLKRLFYKQKELPKDITYRKK